MGGRQCCANDHSPDIGEGLVIIAVPSKSARTDFLVVAIRPVKDALRRFEVV